ncbi:hypothetical protein YPPY55_2133, partial [Yersinia pestis PY-55]
MLELAFAAGGV